MCGIVGIIATRDRDYTEQIKRSLLSLEHRGPDAKHWTKQAIDPNWNLWLGHTRLSILDLTEHSDQPFEKNSDLLCFNGEIYNYLNLNAETPSPKFRSDTEALMHGLQLKGVSLLSELNGMFAFAFYKDKDKSLVLARDRFGKKPLYYFQTSQLLVFASELSAILDIIPKPAIDEEALHLYRWLGYVPGEFSIYKGIKKFKSASWARIEIKGDYLPPLKIENFWDPLSAASDQFCGSYDDAIDQFWELFDDATKMRVESSDVQVASFLSGGIDSSLVAASLAKLHSNCKFYTVAFAKSAFDESLVARSTAEKLGLDLVVLYFDDAQFSKQWKKFSNIFGEPFSDSSQLSTLAISEVVKEHTKVVLTGDGGDEVFLGYPRYASYEKFHKLKEKLNRVGLAPRIAEFLTNTDSKINFFAKILSVVTERLSNPKAFLKKLNYILSDNPTPFKFYDRDISVRFRDNNSLFVNDSLMDLVKSWYPEYGWDALQGRSHYEHLAILDLIIYMKDDVLVKVDRSTMRYGVEARSPLLDWRIVEFGLSLPVDFKLDANRGKKILRDALARRVDTNLSKLGKRAFAVPIPKGISPAYSPMEAFNRYVEQKWFDVNGI